VSVDSYAESVVGVLREHFPDLADPMVAAALTTAIKRQVRDPHDAFEFIVDDPVAANWRLKARSDDRRRVHLACYRIRTARRESDVLLTHTVNGALAALDGINETIPPESEEQK
jgi:hypothetical protein